MVTFAELVKTVEHLSEDEIDELQEILKKKKEEDLLRASENATKEYEEGQTISLKSPEEIESFFKTLINDND